MNLSAETTGIALKGALSALNCIPHSSDGGRLLIRASASGINLSATNLSQSVSCEMFGSGSGETMVSTDMLAMKVSALESVTPVKLASSQTGLILSQGRSKWIIPEWPSETFPEELSGDLQVEGALIPAKKFVGPIGVVEGAKEESANVRPFLVGVRVDQTAIVATDSTMMFCMPGDNPVSGYTIPAESITSILKLFKDSVELTLKHDGNWLSIESDGTRYRTKLLSEKYPDWSKFIPAEDGVKVSASVKALQQATKQACAISTRKGAGALSGRLYLRIGRGIAMSSSNDFGEAGESFCEAQTDGEETIAVSIDRWNKTLASCTWTTTIIEFHGQAKPIMIYEEGRRDNFRLLFALRS